MIKKITIRLSIVLVVLFLALAAAYYNTLQIARWHIDLPPFTHNNGETFSEKVPMDDGIQLHIWVTLPEGEGSWPTILMRNPYMILDKLLKPTCKIFMRYGYACAIQHVRGQGYSEGTWTPLMNEERDGSNTLYWLAEQDWVDGNIGMWGVSYLALVQWAAAFDAPPELKTIVPISMGTDFHKVLFENGAFRHFVTWWMLVMPDSDPNIINAEEERFIEAVKHLPHTEVDELYTEQKLEWYQSWIASMSKNAPIWSEDQAVKLSTLAENLEIPVLLIDGWYDPFFGSVFKDYTLLGSKDKSAIIIGPWKHLQGNAGDLLPKGIDSAKTVSIRSALEWFEYHLKNRNVEQHKAGYIKVYDMGAYEWMTYDIWPPNNELVSFSLNQIASANDCESGVLTKQAPPAIDINNASDIQQTSQEESISYTFDPDNPVMTRGGAGFIFPTSGDIGPGSVLQGNICQREDVLTFTTDTLLDAMTIVGEVNVHLQVSSDAEDTMFTAKIMDVQPDGSVVNIRDSATTLALRNGAVSPLVYEPNSQVNVTINMWAIHWTLKPGHRLRLDISSSNLPAYHLHSNFAGPWETRTERKIARQTLYAPSSLDIPVEVNQAASVTK